MDVSFIFISEILFFQILIVYLLSQKHCYTQRVSRDKGASNLLFTKKRHKLFFSLKKLHLTCLEFLSRKITKMIPCKRNIFLVALRERIQEFQTYFIPNK